ncbi:uncharacterized protein LOC105445625 [Strongylocentrotus purpuratus]|uniref:Ig-like domain-containing protein n=1 Tax=Strongylocentrotus purpuratus TaxID=7668 RepID=A0A7M7HIG6_STRPU|nr:uncharacterized protein LOC105445625 [Strongylocentrotus purpuratus]|eukprot:XP_011679692.1 PREDICTED: uncharacterized protein LOC105445625 [Strongylocentrotus purpuratus]
MPELSVHVLLGPEASIVSVVETIPEITVTFGEEGLLTCAYERKPYAVYWKFLSDSSSIDLLVVLDQYYQVGKRSGPGYDAGRYNVTNDFSLLIHDVSVKDEGRYICEVSDFETGRVFRNYTNVTVTVKAIRPLVRVHQCGSNSPGSVNVTDNPKASCMIKTIPDQRHVQLDCFVEGAKPQVDMFWMDNTTLQDLSNGTFLTITPGKREGTVDQKLTVILQVSEFQSEDDYFTCIAEGPAVEGISSVTVGINNVKPGVPTSAIAAATDSSSVVLMVVVVVLVVLVVVVVVVIIAVLLCKKYKRPQDRTEDDRPVDIETGTLLSE